MAVGSTPEVSGPLTRGVRHKTSSVFVKKFCGLDSTQSWPGGVKGGHGVPEKACFPVSLLVSVGSRLRCALLLNRAEPHHAKPALLLIFCVVVQFVASRCRLRRRIKSQLLCQLSYAPVCEENTSEGQRNYIIALAPPYANLHWSAVAVDGFSR